MNPSDETDIYTPAYDFVRAVPPGKVVTYGQVAEFASGVSLTARQVGAALFVAPKDVPWQRVVGAGGMLPIGKRGPELQARQRELLQAEGVVFLSNAPDKIDMARCQWRPPTELYPDAPPSQASLFEDGSEDNGEGTL